MPPRKHALCSRWLWTSNHNKCENRLSSRSCYQFSLPANLSFKTHGHVYSLCVERNAPCQWDLAIDKAKPSSSAVKWQGDDTDLQCQAARHCHHQVQWATWVAWHWGSGTHSEGEKAPLVWICRTLQWCSQDSLWHTGWWKAWAWEASGKVSGSVGCTSDWRQEVAGSTLAEVGNILLWRLIVKYFLRSFSPFRWFKKGS